jgi:hypothetical protein
MATAFAAHDESRCRWVDRKLDKKYIGYTDECVDRTVNSATLGMVVAGKQLTIERNWGQ